MNMVLVEWNMICNLLCILKVDRKMGHSPQKQESFKIGFKYDRISPEFSIISMLANCHVFTCFFKVPN